MPAIELKIQNPDPWRNLLAVTADIFDTTANYPPKDQEFDAMTQHTANHLRQLADAIDYWRQHAPNDDNCPCAFRPAVSAIAYLHDNANHNADIGRCLDIVANRLAG